MELFEEEMIVASFSALSAKNVEKDSLAQLTLSSIDRKKDESTTDCTTSFALEIRCEDVQGF